MSRYKDSHDALDALVNYYVDCEDRKEAEKLIKQDLDKLSKLENFEEELNIDLLELIEDFKKTKEELKDILNEHPEITPDYMAYTLSNGITYRKLTEKLGCPLDVVFEALSKGIEYEIAITTFYAVGDTIPTKRLEKRKNIQEIKLKKYIDKFTFFVPYDYSRSGIVKNDIIYLKDYRKTWWLKGENNE